MKKYTKVMKGLAATAMFLFWTLKIVLLVIAFI